MTRYHFLLILTVIGLIALTTQLNFNNESTIKPVASIVIPNNIDYYLTHSKQKSFNQDGSIDFTLNSDLLEHYKQEDESTLLNPDAVVHRSNSWRIQANQGHFYHPTEIIKFKYNVLLNKHNSSDTFRVSSNTLLFNIQQDLVISETSVKVQADTWHLNAETMALDINKDIHQFTQITARYRYDKKS